MATKINKATVKNIKNISEFIADLNGMTAYIIAGNTKGKTTFIRFLFDRLNGVTNDASVLRDKNNEGVAEIVMSDGCKFRYIITPEGKEKLIYSTQGIEVKATKEIINKYIAKPFDIDKFLNAEPKQKVEILTKALNIDVTAEKTELQNLISERRIYGNMVKEKEALVKNFQYVDGDPIDITALEVKKQKMLDEYSAKLKEVELQNRKLREEYDKKFDELLKKMLDFNAKQQELKSKKDELNNVVETLSKYDDLKSYAEAIKAYADKITPQPEKTIDQLKAYIGEFQPLPAPDKPDTSAIDKEIEMAKEHNRKLESKNEYIKLKEDYEKTLMLYNNIDTKVKTVEAKIKEKMSTINLPHGLEIKDDNIYYNGFPVDSKHLSLSELYIVGLMLGAMNLKELKVLYFDCSPLDKISMQKVLDFARENDLQLLIEKPDFDGGELRFELIEE